MNGMQRSRSVRELEARARWRYADLFRFSLRLVRTGRATLVHAFPGDIPKGVVLYHYTKAVNLLDSIRHLCKMGFAREAMAPSRTMLSMYITLRWLVTRRDRDAQIERFADFQALTKANNALALVKFEPQLTTAEKRSLRARHRSQIRRIARKYGVRRGKKSGKYPSWTTKQIGEMAEEIKRSDEYHITYARLSQTEHTDPESISEYLDERDDGSLVPVVGPSERFLPVVMIDSMKYYLNIRRDAAGVLGFQWTDHDEVTWRSLFDRYENAIAEV